MDLILLERIRKLGNVGDIVTVKNGYGRNFLIPHNKAILATESNKKYFEEKKEEIQTENKKKLAQAEELSKKFKKLFIDLIRQASEDGRLFGSITARCVADAISAETGEKVEKSTITLSDAIKYIGIYDFELTLHPEVIVKGHVNIAKSESEAKEAKESFLSGETSSKNKSANEAA